MLAKLAKLGIILQCVLPISPCRFPFRISGLCAEVAGLQLNPYLDKFSVCVNVLPCLYVRMRMRTKKSNTSSKQRAKLGESKWTGGEIYELLSLKSEETNSI